jgi:hypothetical protein
MGVSAVPAPVANAADADASVVLEGFISGTDKS